MLEDIGIYGERRIEEFKSQDLANTASGFAALAVRGVRADAFMTAVAGAALKRLTGTGSTGSTAFTAQGISNIIWAMATVAILQKPLLEAFSFTFGRAKLQEWKAQELSNTAWAFATLLVMDPVIDAISDMAFQQLENFGFRHSANLAWALATLEKTNEPLLTAMAVAAAANASELSPLSLASTAWACVSMKIIYFPLLDAMSELLFQSPVDDAALPPWPFGRCHVSPI